MVAAVTPRMRLVRPSERPEDPPQSDDSAVVARARDGETSAQAELFRSYAPRLLPMLIHLLSSKSDAEDALQDAFVAAFRDLGQLKDASAFSGWLRQIAVHQAHRRFRRRRLFGALGLDRPADDATLEQLADTDANPVVRAELSLVDRLLRKMPTSDRVAWMLRYVEGYELSEVATACGCSLATAKRRIAAAHLRIAKHVDVGEVDDE
jgi:RNA polymerase sigma-70 factor (ECF subfamily)